MPPDALPGVNFLILYLHKDFLGKVFSSGKDGQFLKGLLCDALTERVKCQRASHGSATKPRQVGQARTASSKATRHRPSQATAHLRVAFKEQATVFFLAALQMAELVDFLFRAAPPAPRAWQFIMACLHASQNATAISPEKSPSKPGSEPHPVSIPMHVDHQCVTFCLET